MLLIQKMAGGRLWVCRDHCQAPGLTLPTYFHPPLESHIEVLWSTEQLFTLYMVVPGTVRSLCIFRALTTLVAHAIRVLLFQEQFSQFWKIPFQVNDLNNCSPCSKGNSSRAGNDLSGAWNYTFHSCKWLLELWMLTAHCIRDSDDGHGDKCIQKILVFFCMFYPRVGVTGDEIEAQIHSVSIPCSLYFDSLLFWQRALRLHAKYCFGGPFLLEMQLLFLLSKTFAIIP